MIIKPSQETPVKSRSKPHPAGRSLAVVDDNQANQRRRANNLNVMNDRLDAADHRKKNAKHTREYTNHKSVCQFVSSNSSELLRRQEGPESGRLGEQENMTRLSESPLALSRPESIIGEPAAAAAAAKAAISSCGGPNHSSTNNEHSSNLAKKGARHEQNEQQRNQRQQSGGRHCCQSKAAAPFSMPSLPLCLCLFALSLFSSTTTTTLVNGIKLQPEGREKFYWSGEQFVITCQNNNNIKNVKIRWSRPNGQPITDDRKDRFRVESNGARLVATDLHLGIDDGRYTCAIIEGSRTRETAEFTLKVLKGTSFKDTAKHVTLKAGQSGRVECHVEFEPSAQGSVTWLKNQQPIDLLNDSSIHSVEYDSSRQVSSLRFNPVKREHDDEYTCQTTAVTPNLSKIVDYKINVEVQFGPVCDAPEQTIWVESIQAINGRLHQSGQGAALAATSTGSSHQQTGPATIPHRNVFGANSRSRGGRLRPSQEVSTEQQPSSANGGEQLTRVELKCTCQANPEASIVWSVVQQNLEITKNSPSQVVEDPQQTQAGHNVTSTLVISYNLDPNWEQRRQRYRCSASNSLGVAAKIYNIEQGNPPPGFSVGAHKSYNPDTTEFNFTLLGPTGNELGSLANIEPPVDSFRIRSEMGPAPGGSSSSSAATSSGHSHQDHHQHHHQSQEFHSSASHLRRQGDPAHDHVHVAVALGPETSLPKNVTVRLGQLKSGVQRLYLEAHNAVGYSLNSTYLGEYNLVSSALSPAILNKLNLVILLASQLLALATYLRSSHS